LLERGRALGGDGEGAFEGDADAAEGAFFEEAADESDAVRNAARGRNFGEDFWGRGPNRNGLRRLRRIRRAW